MTGLYIKGCVNSEEVVFTVDTGVSVSLLAKHIYDCLFEKPELDNGNTKLKMPAERISRVMEVVSSRLLWVQSRLIKCFWLQILLMMFFWVQLFC